MEKDIKHYKLGNTIQEFEEMFGNVPFNDIEKIKKYLLQNYIPKSKALSIIRDIQDRTEKLINSTYVPLSSRIYDDNKEKYEPMLIGRTIAMGALQSLQELMEDK